MANIADVAKLARVSTATVSAVVNGRDIVEARTRRRVQAAIEKLNYQPNLYASSLARRQQRLLGLIVSDIGNPFFAEIAQEVQREALARDYQLAFATTDFSAPRLLALVRQMVGLRVAGLAIMTSEMEPQVLEVLARHRVPTIFEDVGTAGELVSNIRIDYEGGIFMAVKYLADLGHRRILFVRSHPAAASERRFQSLWRRSQAFLAAARTLAPAGVRAEVVQCAGPGPQAGLQAAQRAIADGLRFTAAVAIADPVALGLLRGLRQAGRRVPEDVSVIGFDNSYLCDFTEPPLTSVDVPRVALARMAVETLIRNVEQQEPGKVLALPTRLFLRESTAPPRPRRGRE